MAIAHKGYPAIGSTDTPYDDFSQSPAAASGSAVTNGADPFAKNHASPYAAGITWGPQETPVSGSDYRQSNPAYQANGAEEGLTRHEISFWGRLGHWAGQSKRNHVVTINDRAERVAWSDEGPLSKDPTPPSDGTQPTEPSNNSGKWSVANFGRVLRAGVGYTFFRNWEVTAVEKQVSQGAHISLADNAVVLPVGGMEPQYRKNMRNTYRIEPEPWDLNLVDKTADPTQSASPPMPAVVPGNVSGSSYRLG